MVKHTTKSTGIRVNFDDRDFIKEIASLDKRSMGSLVVLAVAEYANKRGWEVKK